MNTADGSGGAKADQELQSVISDDLQFSANRGQITLKAGRLCQCGVVLEAEVTADAESGGIACRILQDGVVLENIISHDGGKHPYPDDIVDIRPADGQVSIDHSTVGINGRKIINFLLGRKRNIPRRALGLG